MEAETTLDETKHARALDKHAGVELRAALDDGWVLADSIGAGTPVRRKLGRVLDTLEDAVERRTSALVWALKALLVPGDHLPHPIGECTGECRDVRRVLGLEASTTPVIGQMVLPDYSLTCDVCNQRGEPKGGEYPCLACDRPTLHDDPQMPMLPESEWPTSRP